MKAAFLAAALVMTWFVPTAVAARPAQDAIPQQAVFSSPTNRHIQRANRFLAKCLAPTAPTGEDIHNYDVPQGEFIVWWGSAEYQAGTVQVWWAHWPKKDHNPTLAGVVFSTFGISVPSGLYDRVDACTSKAVNLT